jgi:hypothetical protein
MTGRELMLPSGGVIAPRVLRAPQKATPVISFLGVASPGPFAPFVTVFHRGLNVTG